MELLKDNSLTWVALNEANPTTFWHVNMCVVLCNAAKGRLTLLYYKSVFIASISDAVSQHPVSPQLCTHTKTELKRKERVGAGWGSIPNPIDYSM